MPSLGNDAADCVCVCVWGSSHINHLFAPIDTILYSNSQSSSHVILHYVELDN